MLKVVRFKVQTTAIYSIFKLSNMVGPCPLSVKMYSWVFINMLKNIEELDCLFAAAYADIVLTVLYFAALFTVFLHPTLV